MASIFITSNSEFYNTYKLYREYINYKAPYSYNQWIRLRDEFKAAALYVQFYNEITLAWYKVKTSWSIEEEGVECINQYLIKNVSKIVEDKKRFTPAYIYRVAYNCLYCVCIDPSKNKERYYSETSDRFDVGDDELSWFDVLGYDVDFEKDSFDSQVKEFFDELDEGCQIYIQYVLGELTPTKTYYAFKRFDDRYKSCKRDEVIEIITEIYPAKIRDLLIAHFDLGDFNF